MAYNAGRLQNISCIGTEKLRARIHECFDSWDTAAAARPAACHGCGEAIEELGVGIKFIGVCLD